MRTHFLWMLALVSGKLFALDCADAQKVLLQLPADQLAQINVTDEAFSDTPAFVNSKPSLDGTAVFTRSLRVADASYEQLWCKLKSQEAIESANKWEAASPMKDCRDLQALQLQAAMQELGVSGKSLQDLGIRLNPDQDFATGAQWAPSQVAVERKNARVSVQAMRLKSPTWLPFVGGMNYCKILSSEGSLQLIKDQQAASARLTARANPSASWQPVQWSGNRQEQKALLYLNKPLANALEEAKGSFIISPGAEIPAEAMSGLAARLSERGFITFIIQYSGKMPILDSVSGNGNSAVNLASKLKQNPADIQGLDASSLQSKPVYVLGHSLGGATLAGEVYKDGAPSVFDHIYLYGTSSFVKLGGSNVPSSSPITFLFGENDGLSSRSLAGILKSFSIPYQTDNFEPVASSAYPNVQYQKLKDLNHFCIISDAKAGNGLLKRQDGKGLDTDACVSHLVTALGLD